MSRSLSTSGRAGAEAVCVCVCVCVCERESVTSLMQRGHLKHNYFSRLCFRAALQLGHLSLEEAMNAIHFLTPKP